MDTRKELLSKTIQIKISDLGSAADSPVLVQGETHAPGLPLRRPIDSSKYQILLQSVYDGVFITEEDGAILDVNEKAAELVLQDKATLCRMSMGDLILGLEGAVLLQISENIRNGKRVLIEAYCLRKDDSTFPSEVAVNRVSLGPERTHLCFFVRNVIHHKLAEEALRMAQLRMARAERLETAGTVAGQIAHDFNNLLTPLLGYPSLIRREIPPDSRAREYVDIVEKTAQDMAHLTEQLLSLSRRGHVGQEVFSPNDVIQETLTLIRSTIPAGITVSFEPAPDLMYVKGGREQVARVMHNLCQNAIDAMGEAGVLGVKTENIYLEAPVGQYTDVNIGEYVRITVTDTGHGIPDEIKERIFDPFFTTKKASKRRGSGLGLSIVHGIVKDHKGYIDLETTVGTGTRFSVYFPICREAGPAPVPGLSGPGRESVLVVDDDLIQVEVVAQLLSALGYRVAGVRSGEEAVKLVRDSRTSYDIVMLDMVMKPGMDGLEAMDRIRAVRPEQGIILMSGFPESDMRAAELVSRGGATYVKKPLTADKLGLAVQKELDRIRRTRREPEKSILIVDDEEQMRKLLAMIINSEFPDVRIDAACDGAQAVECVLATRPRLVIMDLHMPGSDGAQAFSRIREEFAARGWDPPAVIFCTGFSLPEPLKRIIEEDSRHSYIQKPIEAESLLDAVRERLK